MQSPLEWQQDSREPRSSGSSVPMEWEGRPGRAEWEGVSWEDRAGGKVGLSGAMKLGGNGQAHGVGVM